MPVELMASEPARFIERSRRPGRFELGAVSIPAGEFTGDLYFTLSIGGRTWVALGDVAGKGLHASLFMAMIQEELEQRISEDPTAEPSTIVQSIHKAICPEFPVNRFATLVLARFQADGSGSLVNAGHSAPLIARRDGTIECLGPDGPPVGIVRGSVWREQSIRLRDGETILLFSDGLHEAFSPSEEELGFERIRESLRVSRNRTPTQLVRQLEQERHEFAQGRRSDDLTILAMRYRA